jgi:hypothetical protein
LKKPYPKIFKIFQDIVTLQSLKGPKKQMKIDRQNHHMEDKKKKSQKMHSPQEPKRERASPSCHGNYRIHNPFNVHNHANHEI